MTKAFYLDATRCTGCKTCVFACKDKNDLDLGVAYRRVCEFTGGETTKDEMGCYSTSCFSYYISVSCNHCDTPACQAVCPQSAIMKDEETGLMSVDHELCIGCGACTMACEYGAPVIDPEMMKAVRCNGCADLVAKGEKPICVMACPAQALKFGDVEEMAALGEMAAIAPLPEPVTMPNYYIKPCRDAKPCGSEEGVLANPLEVM